jgi:hypothetical protein
MTKIRNSKRLNPAEATTIYDFDERTLQFANYRKIQIAYKLQRFGHWIL